MLLIACVVSLPACVTTPNKPVINDVNTQHFKQLNQIKTYQLTAKIGVQMPKQGYSGSLKWQHKFDEDKIIVYSPVGSQVAVITQTARRATFKNNKGETFKASNAHDLIAEHLGWQFPVDALHDWLLARPKNLSSTQHSFDKKGRLTQLNTQGWSIDYAGYADWHGYHLPKKITLKNATVRLKIIANDWQLNQ